MERNFLSDIELYYSTSFSNNKQSLVLLGEEARHVSKVMRHQTGEEIFATNGEGSIFKISINEIGKDFVAANILSEIRYKNEYENVIVCIPIIKNFDRLEFALEKCVELGITNIIFFKSERSFKKNPKLDRWQKIATAAMKQSLRSFLPKLEFIENITKICGGKIIVFDQKSKTKFADWKLLNKKCYFFFGPEGGFSDIEMNKFANPTKLKLTENRLRSETAVITFAAQLALILDKP